MSRYASEGAGRYDRLHGDEPEIEAERYARIVAREAYEEDHWEDFDWQDKD